MRKNSTLIALAPILACAACKQSTAEFRDPAICPDLQVAVQDAESNELDRAGNAVDRCVNDHAVLYARGSDSAADVATALIVQCGGHITRLTSVWIEASGAERGALLEIRSQIEADTTRKAIHSVVIARAGRCWLPESPLATTP